MQSKFEWNHAKDRSNQRKHGVSFSEARQLIESGDRFLEIFDADDSVVEDRFVAVGTIDRGLVVVVYAEPDDDLIRIIGARFANARERNLYRRYLDQQK